MAANITITLLLPESIDWTVPPLSPIAGRNINVGSLTRINGVVWYFAAL